MEAPLVGLVWTGVALVIIVAITGFLLLRRVWLMAGSGVGLAVAIAMLAATRFALWRVPALPGQAVLAVALLTLAVAVVRARGRGRRVGGAT